MAGGPPPKPEWVVFVPRAVGLREESVIGLAQDCLFTFILPAPPLVSRHYSTSQSSVQRGHVT